MFNWVKNREFWEKIRAYLADQEPGSVVKVYRPDYDECFMCIAMVVATRSIDAQWQAGCVLTKDNRILSTGYNSFPSNMPDEYIPNTRPGKYPWIIHSEANAIYNSNDRNLDGATCYTNGKPCLECLKALYQCGIRDLVITKGQANMVSAQQGEINTKYIYDQIIELGGISIREIEVSDDTVKKFQEIFEKSN